MAKPRKIPEWQNKPRNPGIPPQAVEAIARRRRQMLIHSYIYYCLNDSVIDDHTWQKWAKQLAQLQYKFGDRIGFYDEAFADWDGSTGYHLPFDPNVVRVARRILDDVTDTREMLS